MRHLFNFAAVALLFSAASLLAAKQDVGSPSPVREITTFQSSDFTSRFTKGGAIGPFALSLDGTLLAVEFAIDEGQGIFGDWLVLWNIQDQRIIKSQRVEGPDPETDQNYSYRHSMCFAPDGRILLVLTGPRLLALSLPDLRIVYAIKSPVPRARTETGRFLAGFSVATKAERLAVFYQSEDRPSTDVEIDDLTNGQTLQRYTLRGSGSVALSPDGSLLALVANPVGIGTKVPSNENNVFVFDANVGNLVRAFNTTYVAGEAHFLPDGKRLVTIPAEHETPSLYSLDTVKVWNVSTGRMERELRYKKYGVRGAISLSSDGKLLAAVTYWHNPRDLRFDRDVNRGFTRLLIWNLDSEIDRPVFASPDLQGYATDNSSWLAVYRVNFSTGDRLAVGGERITVYSTGGVSNENARRLEN